MELVKCTFFPPDAYKVREAERRAAHDWWRANRGDTWTDDRRRMDASFFPPGSMWLCPWYHDPQDPEDVATIEPSIASLRAGKKSRYLSIHYWKRWARIRPPIMVVCPRGGQWCVDAGSSNGTGWTVQGDPPNLVVTPSIWISMSNPASPTHWHGFLGSSGAPPGHFKAC